MSLILDALNRSRQDTDTVPGLATQHYSEEPESRGSKLRQYLPWAALLLAVVIIALLLLDRAPRPGPISEGSPVITPGPEPSAAEPLSERINKQPLLQSPPASPAVAGGAAPEALAPAPPQPEIESPAEQPAAQPAAGMDKLDPSVAKLYQQPAVSAPKPDTKPATAPEAATAENANVPATAKPPAVSKSAAVIEPEQTAAAATQEQPIDIEKMVLQARDELADANLEEHPAPFIASLSQQSKNDIPTIYYQRHDYSGDSARSTVVLNGKTLKVGGTAAPGVKVKEILPDSVVLDYRGKQFRLRSLNSWINL